MHTDARLRSSPSAEAGRSQSRLLMCPPSPRRVAILAQRGGRAQPQFLDAFALILVPRVAILAQRGGRAQLRGNPGPSPLHCRCDPRPARRPGAAPAPSPQPRRSPAGCDPRPARRPGAAAAQPGPTPHGRHCCDPRPARRPGAACVVRHRRDTAGAVAILAQRGGRAQLARSRPAPPRLSALRSSPSAEAGRSAAPYRLSPSPRRCVAILAQRGGRAQHVLARLLAPGPYPLRSSPSAEAGRSCCVTPVVTPAA